MVLPKEVRDKAGIRAGDKLALVSWEKEGRLCCFTLIKVEEFTDMVRGLLGPMPRHRSVRVMVTMPSEAASNAGLIEALLRRLSVSEI